MVVRIACAVGWPFETWGVRKELWLEAPKEEQVRLAATALEVIREMRKPTVQMTKAACAAMSPGKRPTSARVGNKAKHAIRYQAMIDAALAEIED
jgi:hypothetical protein